MSRIFLALDNLKKQDEELTDEINRLKVALPTNYVTNEKFDGVAAAIFRKLDHINDRLYELHNTEGR